MPLVKTGSPRICLGHVDDILTAEIPAVVLALGVEVPASRGVAVHSINSMEVLSVTCEDLRAAAKALDAALAAAVRYELPAYDVDPGESSDSDGGSTDGCRLRVRVVRASEDDKWGVTWHQLMFKKQQRLVVEDIREETIMSRWNDSQSETRALRYGDRLIRINGKRCEQTCISAKDAAAAMRAELQKMQIRAVFWRPGESEKLDKKMPKKPLALPGRVLIACPKSNLTIAAAVVVAHAILYGDGREQELDLETASAMALADAAGLLSVQQLPSAVRLALGALIQSNIGSEEDAQDIAATVDDSMTAADQVASPLPKWTYSCRKCGMALFHDVHVSEHASVDLDEAEQQSHVSGSDAQPMCTSVFVEPMKWMGDTSAQQGRLLCANPRCKQKLGAFCWHGLPCSCGEWQSPGFQVHKARVDCMPAGGRHARGPTPVAQF